MSLSRINFSKTFFTVLFILICALSIHAQDIKVSGKFLADSIKIGQPVGYALNAHYPQHLTILFPDSAYSFYPFEFEKKVFFPTSTTNGYSSDSTVYYFTTFEIDEIQKLSLPAFLVSIRDCTAVVAEPDSIFLIGLTTTLPDTVNAQNLPLKTSIIYEDVPYQFNYVITLIILASIIILGLVTWFIFGKRIMKYFKIRRITKKHHEFISLFTSLLQELNAQNSSEKTEQTVFLWKKYMEYLEQKPYTKLTTRETALVTPDELLKESLKNIDSAIYGHTHNVINALEYLKQFSDNQFQKKLTEVEHG